MAISTNPSPNAVYITALVLRALCCKKINQAQAAGNNVRVIVTFKTANSQSGALKTDAISSARASALEALSTESYEVVSDYQHIPAASMKINRAVLFALRANPAVAYINEDREVFMAMTEANGLTGVGSVLYRFITTRTLAL